MTTVAQILEKKGNEVHKIGPDDTVFDAVDRMVRNNCGSLLVLERDSILGIITERDYLRDIALKNRASKSTAVKDIMSTRLVCVQPSDTAEDCMAMMSDKRIRHLPVLENGKLAGIISVGDLIKQVVKDQDVHIRYLTDYIEGKYPG